MNDNIYYVIHTCYDGGSLKNELSFFKDKCDAISKIIEIHYDYETYCTLTCEHESLDEKNTVNCVNCKFKKIQKSDKYKRTLCKKCEKDKKICKTCNYYKSNNEYKCSLCSACCVNLTNCGCGYDYERMIQCINSDEIGSSWNTIAYDDEHNGRSIEASIYVIDINKINKLSIFL